jgi:hypothetical protein
VRKFEVLLKEAAIMKPIWDLTNDTKHECTAVRLSDHQFLTH